MRYGRRCQYVCGEIIFKQALKIKKKAVTLFVILLEDLMFVTVEFLAKIYSV